MDKNMNLFFYCFKFPFCTVKIILSNSSAGMSMPFSKIYNISGQL